VTANLTNLPPEVMITYTASLGSVTDTCKNGGWKHLTDENGHPFKNQGDCVSYVASGGKNPANG